MIRFKEVRLISSNGDQLGQMSSREAMRIAIDSNLDLVCVAPNSRPPVCRIMDYGKYRYEQQRRTREAKKNQKTVSIKEVRLSPVIDKHDFETKMRNARKFLEKGDKVKVSILFRGRMIVHKAKGPEIANNFASQLEDIAQFEAKPKMDGRNLIFVLAPLKK